MVTKIRHSTIYVKITVPTRKILKLWLENSLTLYIENIATEMDFHPDRFYSKQYTVILMDIKSKHSLMRMTYDDEQPQMNVCMFIGKHTKKCFKHLNIFLDLFWSEIKWFLDLRNQSIDSTIHLDSIDPSVFLLSFKCATTTTIMMREIIK